MGQWNLLTNNTNTKEKQENTDPEKKDKGLS